VAVVKGAGLVEALVGRSAFAQAAVNESHTGPETLALSKNVPNAQQP